MFLFTSCTSSRRFGFPRIRGDVPAWLGELWSGVVVFPAYAGMFRAVSPEYRGHYCFPRIRGDVPLSCLPRFDGAEFSPHTRGCSCASRYKSPGVPVFPAYAGMFLKLTFLKWIHSSFPRIRGDVPLYSASGKSSGAVFPAYAGMFLRLPLPQLLADGFPRIRGDVPLMLAHPACLVAFSPHTRGCSEWLMETSLFPCVFPAYAGMFRH